MLRHWLRLPTLSTAAIAFFLLTAIANAEIKYKISVSVSADEGSTKEMLSCINRELRTLGDVTVVASDPRFTLQVVLMRPELDGGRTVGWVASMVVLDHEVTRQLIRDARPQSLSNYFPPENFRDVGELATHYVMADPTVAALCKRIVANLDVDAIEGARRVDAIWLEAAKEVLKENPK